MDLLTAALEYVKHGWYVFPLKPNEKTPLYNGGVNDATKDEQQIKKWWKGNAHANIGIALKPSGLGVIDIDFKPEKGKDGWKSLDDLALLYGMPKLARQETPTGGTHFLYKEDKERPTIDRIGWENGIDILSAKHRYIVAYPSTVEAGMYKWKVSDWKKVTNLPTMWYDAIGMESSTQTKGMLVIDSDDELLTKASQRIPGVRLEELKAILDVLDPAMSRDKWLEVIWGAACQWKGTEQEADALMLIEQWSSHTKTKGQYKAGESAQKWEEHDSRKKCSTWKTVRMEARKVGWQPEATEKNWQERLHKKMIEEVGMVVLPDAHNVALILQHHDKFKGGLKLNKLTHQIEVHNASLLGMIANKSLPKVYIKNVDVVSITSALHGMVHGAIKDSSAEQAINVVANNCPYDPIMDYFNALKWDGKLRIDDWISTLCNISKDPLNAAIGRAWLIGLVSRAMCVDLSGAKMDNVLIFQGAEGIGKSSVAQILGGEWYGAFSSSLHGDELYYCMENKLVLELAELDTLQRSEVGRIKALVTTQADTFRRKYSPVAETMPRRCVYLGTVNDEEFLTRDMTLRRWWLIRCKDHVLNLEWLRANREQLLAEAKVAYQKGGTPTIPLALKSTHTASIASAIKTHPYEEIVDDWTAKKPAGDSIKMSLVTVECLGKSMAQVTIEELKTLSKCLTQAGWCKKHTMGGKVWVLDKRGAPAGKKGLNDP
jgi:predicted P-loop ATPase